MNRLQHIQHYHNWYGLGLFALFLSINAAVLATSVVMEASRKGAELPFQLWEPFVWEYTSILSIIMLTPVVNVLLEKQVFNWSHIARSVIIFIGAAVAFSILHVSLMVAMRKLVYWALGRHYSFGSLVFEFIYELRKDVMTFIIIVTLIQGFRFIVSRLMGEANLVAEEEMPVTKSRNRLLVKKLGKEFIVKLEDIEWMEASGNYVNLHIKDRIYPIRKTLTALTAEIGEVGFRRIHRSHAVNLDYVDSITPLPSGDGEIKLKSGKVLNISRRYKDELKQSLI